jgi:hypothetical protein
MWNDIGTRYLSETNRKLIALGTRYDKQRNVDQALLVAWYGTQTPACQASMLSRPLRD